MKRLILVILFVFVSANIGYSAVTKMYGREALTGGVKSVDNLLHDSMAEGYLCIVCTDAKVQYLYRFNATSGADQSLPLIIKPIDAGVGDDGRWELVTGVPEEVADAIAALMTATGAAAILDVAGSVDDGSNYPTFSNTAASDTVDELFVDLEDYLASLTTPDENTVESYIFDSDPETISGTWTITDNIGHFFGTDKDVWQGFDIADSRLEWRMPTDSGAVTDEELDISETEITVDDSSLLIAGSVIKVESEYMSVTSIDDGTTITVVRGIYGGAATHATAKTIYHMEPALWIGSSGIGTKPVSAPEISGYDSDAAGADIVDKFAFSVSGNMTDAMEL
jgi:hypothetical protein